MSTQTLVTQARQCTDARLEEARGFVKQIEELREHDRARFAALKRNVGFTLAEARGAAWFYGLQRGFSFGDDEHIYFLVATLVGHNKYDGEGSFGATMYRLWQKTKLPSDTEESRKASSIARRLNILLDADFGRVDGYRPGGGELAFRLRQLVKLAASKKVGVDWAQLLVDLRDWGRPGKRVQRRWAEDFYTPGATPQTDDPGKETPDAG